MRIIDRAKQRLEQRRWKLHWRKQTIANKAESSALLVVVWVLHLIATLLSFPMGGKK